MSRRRRSVAGGTPRLRRTTRRLERARRRSSLSQLVHLNEANALNDEEGRTCGLRNHAAGEPLVLPVENAASGETGLMHLASDRWRK